MGKRQIGEMEPFELVITLIIADLATIPMSDPTIPIWYGILPLLLISVVHCFVSKLQMNHPKFRDFISGKPVTIISEGKIDQAALQSLDMCKEELMELLRNNGYPKTDDVGTAIIERNGKLTVIEKEDK
jgi:uncharacterized membrane protein YcaP (DUF421 family)